MIYKHLCSLFACIHFLFLTSPNTGFSIYILLWLVRIITFSLLLRTYLGPWLLALMSDRIRVRSISLLSIRGLYFRKGARTWRVDRISYIWSSVEGSRRLALKIDGITLHIAEDEEKQTRQTSRRQNRNLTLADLDPSPLARRLWQLISVVTTFLEPYLKPLIRTYVIACLRIGIRWLPTITQAVSFDLQSTVVTFAEVPGAKVVVEEINLHTALMLTQLEQIVDSITMEETPKRPDPRTVQGMGLWKKRLAESFQRSLDKAIGETRGTATISLKIRNVIGTMPRSPSKDSLDVPFLLSRGVLDLGISAKFNPKEGVIDTHGLEISLKIGDCSAKVDLFEVLLDRVLPKKPRPPPAINHAFASPPSAYGVTPLPSFTLGSQPSAALPSPARSFASSLFSPSSLFSASDMLSAKPSPFSPNSAQLLSPRSPSSPFFNAISASMRPRRRHLIQPCVKLKDVKDVSKLSILHNINISVASIGLSVLSDSETGPYKALIDHISVNISLSDPSRNHLHKEHLGSRGNNQVHSSNAYALKLVLRQITLERNSQPHTMRVARLGLVELQTLVFQWPAPFLIPSPFMGNDANASLLAIHLKLANIHFADRIHDLQRIVNVLQTKQKKLKNSGTVSQTPLLPMPRLAIAFECGPVVARIIYDADNGENHRAVEMRNNGFTVSLNSRYQHPSLTIGRFFPAASSVQPLQWQCNLSVNLEPILVRIRSEHNFIGIGEPTLRVSDADFLDDPPVLSIGNLEVSGAFNAIAQIDGAPGSVAIIDKSALVFDLSIAFETICVELWHPISVDAILRMMSIMPAKAAKKSDTVAPSHPRFLHLPIGFRVITAVSRFVVFVTAPDISPNDNFELSRGFAIRTSAALEYCSLQSNQAHWFDSPQRIQKRAELRLLPDTLPDALVAANFLGAPNDKSGFLKMRLANVVFKTALATQYESDDPAIAGREEPPNNPQDVLRIKSLLVDICLSCKASNDRSQYTDICEISAQIPFIHLNFQLAHAYSILLGLQTIRILNPPRTARAPIPDELTTPDIVLMVQANITAIQGILSLPNQKLVVRVDGLSTHFNSDNPPRIKWTKMAAFVTLPAQNNRWEDPLKGKWDEFITLQTWEVCFTPVAGSLCISVDGDSARLRIPYGFVLADLVHDVSVSAKAVRHMAHMASAGCYSEMPSPEPEGPKSVPHLTIRLGYLCVEAKDDPFESRLGLIWQAGAEAVKQRMDREDAFKAKVAAILSAEPQFPSTTNIPTTDLEQEYQFSAKHTVSIEEARRRLDDVHALDWTLRLERAKDRRSKNEHSVLHKLFGTSIPVISDSLPDFLRLPPPPSNPPLLRAMLQNLCLIISPPSFALDRMADVMYEFGSGLPRDTKFSLLVPLHIHFTLSSLLVTLRDYPLPLASIPARTDSTGASWTFDTDLIIGEEMGTELSVEWVQCPIIEPSRALHGQAPFSIVVPKTIMPVKTYAAPEIKIITLEPTTLSWGVSYGPVMQDVMRIVETLSSAPRDPSPAVGFWDKMRLVLHWKAKVMFTGDVRLYMKGTRDPYNTLDTGAGFVLCWQGTPEIRVGYENYQKELIQVMSDGMLIAVPNLESFNLKPRSTSGTTPSQQSKPFQKVCARLSSGVRYGIGFILERSCGPECLYCTGTSFDRKCRYFSFRPHYEVKLEKKSSQPALKGPDDTYNGFRSDFIHLAVSLASSTKSKDPKGSLKSSTLYLTPKVFAHFWSWCSLFDGALSLPIRQGSYHPSRPISPKLGRHLATLKYRISLPHLYFVHGYIDDSRETWVDGIIPWVGVKGKVDELQVDMHQREEESTVPGPVPNTTRTIRKKPFYAAEVIMKGLELRAMLAIFSEPLKQSVQMAAPPQRSNYRKHRNLSITPQTSIWHDLDDFVELDWSPRDLPVLNLLPFVMCPHFIFFKRNSALSGIDPHISKFGSEHSHLCLLGKEPSVPRIQMSLASSRVTELRKSIESQASSRSSKAPNAVNQKLLAKMVSLLEDYIAVLKEVEIKPGSSQEKTTQSYHMPADIVSSDEWAEFENVYQIHCPSIFMDSAVRDIMMQYYYCSRDRRGFEYHMATRAVKFIRDQANAALAVGKEEENDKDRVPANTAQIAASALRKILKSENNSVDIIREKDSEIPGKIDPMDGWAEGVSLLKSHCCLLLKPQIVLRGEIPTDTCVVAAAQAKLQSFAIMDLLNLDDPVSGKVMSRNYTSISGLQAFAPTSAGSSSDGSVPLEVLIDLRCESNAFERLVPQTEATFHYDKFNRLRLRNNITSIVPKASTQGTSGANDNHLQDQTDLIRVHIPRFTVSANAEHFQAISNIVTKLILFSDPAHKTRLDKLETLIFSYDFTDLASAANVVSSLQIRLRDALETERLTMRNARRLEDEDTRVGLLQLKAHIFLLTEELNLLFDAIKMAQDRFDDQTDQKSALLLHASSTEISWRMLDARRNLLSKLVVAKINFYWLSRQDSSTVNHLTIGNLTAFDGSRYAMWSEILSKHDEPANHPLLKRGLFLSANWTILAPVGGITIFEAFELSLHPLRLQVDAKVGQRMMEYVWPGRKARHTVEGTSENEQLPKPLLEIEIKSPTSGRSSIDSPRALHSPKRAMDSSGKTLIPPLRKLGSSRSFTDLRSATDSHAAMSPSAFLRPPAFLKRTRSSDSVNFSSLSDAPPTAGPSSSVVVDVTAQEKNAGDAQVMKTRSSQKSFVLVKISSLHLLLSVVKEGSFECHDAKIKTRELEYRNQTWSFEELVNQFIPSNMSWRGWVKMAFHQPLIPVLPVARELLSKTKWTASKSSQPHDSPLRLLHPGILATDDDRRLTWMQTEGFKKGGEGSSRIPWKNPLRNKDPPTLTSLPLTAEPESMEADRPINPDRPAGPKRVKSLFSKSPRNSSKSRGPVNRQSEDLIKGSS